MHLVIGGCVLQASCCDYIIIIIISFVSAFGRAVVVPVLFGGVAFGPLWAGLVGAAAVPVARSSAPPPSRTRPC